MISVKNTDHLHPEARVFRRAICVLSAAVFLTFCPFAHSEPPEGGAGEAIQPANEKKIDKSKYNLFRPVPDEYQRPFGSSRPDQVTGAYTVDAGHFYLETGVANTLSLGPKRADTWDPLQSSHFRAGLTTNVEFELIYDGYFEQRTQAVVPGRTHQRSDKTDYGSGTLTLRVRRNLVGNDGGPYAISISEQLLVPTDASSAASKHVRGYELLAATIKLPAGFSTVLNIQPGITRNANDTDYQFQFVGGVALYHNVFRKQDNVQLYLEYYDSLATGPASTDARQVDLGVRWRPFKNIQFDLGCNFGVSVDAPDYQPFAGVAMRF